MAARLRPRTAISSTRLSIELSARLFEFRLF
jgi:hypothetical protein